jgi:hypothetical protein
MRSTGDGHGAQFEIRLTNGVQGFPPGLLESIHNEAERWAALYVDGFHVEGNDVIISLCRGGLRLALVDANWNPARADSKFLVILREDRDEGDNGPIGQLLEARDLAGS